MKHLAGPVILLLLLAGCVKTTNDAAIRQSTVKAVIDSTVGARTEELSKSYRDDLEIRMAIEVKAKADSIVATRRRQLSGDTVKKVNANPVKRTTADTLHHGGLLAHPDNADTALKAARFRSFMHHVR